MFSNRRKGNGNKLRASTRRGARTALANHTTPSRKKFARQPGLDHLISGIASGRLGIYRLISVPRNP